MLGLRRCPWFYRNTLPRRVGGEAHGQKAKKHGHTLIPNIANASATFVGCTVSGLVRNHLYTLRKEDMIQFRNHREPRMCVSFSAIIILREHCKNIMMADAFG